jgi:DNA-binding NarL/FixJ family response regulator
MSKSNRIIKVLLVEDHNLVRRAFKRMLEDESDFEIVGEAGEGHEAVKAAKNLRPDAVVMDFTLPGLMGGAVIQKILETAPETAVLVLSMHSEPSYVRASLDAGARGYLLKTALQMDLIEAVRKIMDGHIVLDSRIILPSFLSASATRPPTPRELEILQLIAEGKSNKEIAEILGISAGTVAVHRTNIMQALALGNAAKLTLYAIGRGLINVG